ncbi:MAG: GGDEF domain-containing protein [Lachnospiraceae bacterium]|nr:GGDEF domain-containing protein [Lachnospiraceae bacterium]
MSFIESYKRQKRHNKKSIQALSVMNMQRGMYSGFAATGLCLLLLIMSSFQTEDKIPGELLINIVIYACITFGYALFFSALIKQRVKKLYHYSILFYILLNIGYFTYFSSECYRIFKSLAVYYLIVLSVAIVIRMSYVRYIAVMLLEFGMFFVIYLQNQSYADLGIWDYQMVFFVHLIALLTAYQLYYESWKNVLNRTRLESEAKASEQDPLTLMPNRNGLNKAIDSIKKGISKSGDATHYVGYAILDIDYFKKYNDRYGHPAGDICLKQVASIIMATIKEMKNVTAARIGGEEFVIFAVMQKRREIVKLVEKVCENVREAKIEHIDGPIGVVSVSIGLFVEMLDEKMDETRLYEKADLRLYEAKESGRNQVVSNVKVVSRKKKSE